MKITGIDINLSGLCAGLEKKRLTHAVIGSMDRLPMKEGCADMVIAAEIMEHLPDYCAFLASIHSMLRKGGRLILTVPYDTNLSLWKPFFKVHCFFQGYVMGKEYFKKEAGHINRFSPQNVRKHLEGEGFRIIEQFSNRRFTIFAVAEKA